MRPSVGRGALCLALLSALALPFVVGHAGAATLPPGFQETIVLSGLTEPTAVRFSPDGRVFVAEHGGLVKVFDSLTDPTPSIYADLRTKVHAHDDRGLLGMALHPSFPTVPDMWVSYAHDAAIGGTAPRWGSPGADSDPCPTPPGPTLDGCVISGRLSRLSPGSSTAGTYRDAVLADSPAAYWRLGETTGTSAADASGNGRTGSYVNTPTLGVPGGLAGDANTAVGFDGSSEHVSVPFAASLNPAQFTLETWAYVTGGQGTYRSVASSRDFVPGSTRGYLIYAGPDNTWQFWLGNGSSGWQSVAGRALVLNRWTHLAATYDGTMARLYIDGVQVGATQTSLVPNASRPTRIAAGSNEGAPNFHFPGRVDEVAIYPSALSAARVRTHFEIGSGTPALAVEHVLIEDWCQQYTTGAPGGVEFGADGALYMTAGAGGSYTFNDYGQDGDPLNPCGDPPGGVGAVLSPPTAEGGWLRSQDLRTSGDPVGLGGTLIRVDPMTGAGFAGNPLSGSSDANARRIVAYGFRNPFRIAVRPGTRDVWIGDVGAGTYEEIDRVPDGSAGVLYNFGWPCYEGTIRQPGFDAADLNICENLYQQPGATTAPTLAYIHGSKIVPSETCSTTTGSAVSGLAFTPSNSVYPAAYNGALFFADYSRRCIWVMFAGGNGLPDPTNIQPFVQDAMYPVDLEFGPEGRLYYVDVATGTIRRIDFTSGNQPPQAVATASPTSGTVPLTVNFNGSGSSDPDGTIAAYAWDLDGDGQYDDSTAQNPSFQYTVAGTYNARLRVTDNQGAPGFSSPITITAGSNPPTAFIDQPTPSFTWRAGDVISFAGHGTDPEDGTLPASALSWNVTLQHCTAPQNCHSHPVQSFTGVSSGSFSAPDHEYPSFLQLTLTVRDSSGITDTETLDLNPRTVVANLASSPTGLNLVLNSTSGTTPFSVTLVEGTSNTLSAPSPQVLGGTTYVFSGWSDGGAQTHTITANSTATYTATFTPQTATGYSAAVLADSPLAYWRLGESSGTSAADSSGSNRTGSYVSTPTLGAPGALSGDANSAVGFDGSAEYVSVPYTAALNPTQFTVEGWAYVTGGQGTHRSLVTSRDFSPGNARGYILYAAANNTWQLWTGNGEWNIVHGPPVTLNQWTHVVGTFDGSTARLYINGTLAAFSSVGYLQNAQRPLRVAAGNTDKSNPQYYLPGRVDEVAVYGSALSAARVQAHFTAASSSGGGNQPPVAVASASPTSGTVPLTVSFNGSGSSDPDGTIAAYAWDLDGDGQYDDSTAQNPSFQYTVAGTYNARLRVTDNQGAEGFSSPITITAQSSGGGGSTYSQQVLADSPLAYWRLGESSGTSAADSSGSNRTGSYVSTPTLGAPGALSGDANSAVGFDGSTEYVSVPYTAALNPTQFTVEGWAYVTGGQGTYRSLVTSRDYGGNARGYILYAAANNTWQLWTGSGGWNVVEGPAVTLNQWTHLVATFDGTSARLYVNGALAASAGVSYAQNTVRPLRIASGNTDGAANYFLPGRVDEVAVYGSALSAARVQAHYQAATAP